MIGKIIKEMKWVMGMNDYQQRQRGNVVMGKKLV